MEMRDTTAEIEPKTGHVVQIFTTALLPGQGTGAGAKPAVEAGQAKPAF
jgi:hypothetical protein